VNYYFVGAKLPELQIGFPPEISFEEFINLLKDNLTEKDYAETLHLRQLIDIYNIRSFWKEEPLDTRGTLDLNELDEALLNNGGLPDYVFDYMDEFDTKEKRIANFSQLIVRFFQDKLASLPEGFLKELFQKERDLRLIGAAMRAKVLNRNLTLEMQFEDPTDDLVQQILAQKDSKTFEPPEGYEAVKILYDEYKDRPLDLYKAFLEYRFKIIEEMLGVEIFTLDRIIGFEAQLMLVEDWMVLDKEKGKKKLQTFVGSN